MLRKTSVAAGEGHDIHVAWRGTLLIFGRPECHVSDTYVRPYETNGALTFAESTYNAPRNPPVPVPLRQLRRVDPRHRPGRHGRHRRAQCRCSTRRAEREGLEAQLHLHDASPCRSHRWQSFVKAGDGLRHHRPQSRSRPHPRARYTGERRRGLPARILSGRSDRDAGPHQWTHHLPYSVGQCGVRG